MKMKLVSLLVIAVALSTAGCAIIADKQSRVASILSISTVSDAYVEIESMAVLVQKTYKAGVITKEKALDIGAKLKAVTLALDVGAIGLSKQDRLESVKQVLLKTLNTLEAAP